LPRNNRAAHPNSNPTKKNKTQPHALLVLASLYLLRALHRFLLGPPPGPSRRTRVVDFSVHRPPDSWKVTRDRYDAIVAATGDFDPDSLSFMGKVLRRSGLGDETYAPPSLTQVPMTLTMASCRHEFESVAFDAVRSVLNKSGVHPRQVGVVITNSSLFNLTPSLSAAIMNHFKMPSTTTNYHLAGMGCSAGVIAVDLARQCLENMPETYALVVSTENLTYNWYPVSC
jgi:3-ketoacyl-CoA synthase